jgi:hypothetical protein
MKAVKMSSDALFNSAWGGDGAGDARRVRVSGSRHRAQEKPGECAGSLLGIGLAVAGVLIVYCGLKATLHPSPFTGEACGYDVDSTT